MGKKLAATGAWKAVAAPALPPRGLLIGGRCLLYVSGDEGLVHRWEENRWQAIGSDGRKESFIADSRGCPANWSLAQDADGRLVAFTENGHLHALFPGGKWKLLDQGSGPSPRYHAAFTEAFDGLFLFGGCPDRGRPLRDAWLWKDDRWTALAPKRMPSPRSRSFLAAYDNGQRVLLWGGETAGSTLRDVWEFAEGVWTEVGEFRKHEYVRFAFTVDGFPLHIVMAPKRWPHGLLEVWSGKKWQTVAALPPQPDSPADYPVFGYDSAVRSLFRIDDGRTYLLSLDESLGAAKLEEIVSKGPSKKKVAPAKPKPTTSRRSNSKPDIIASIWNDIERRLSEVAPQIRADLRPGAKAAAIRKSEKQLAVKLPDDFALSLALHDGQNGREPIAGEWLLLSLDQIVRQWDMLRQLHERGDFAGATAKTKGPVRSEWWNVGWIPFASNESGDFYCVDLAPKARGTSGQVIAFWHDRDLREVIAADYRHWLVSVSDQLSR